MYTDPCSEASSSYKIDISPILKYFSLIPNNMQQGVLTMITSEVLIVVRVAAKWGKGSR